MEYNINDLDEIKYKFWRLFSILVILQTLIEGYNDKINSCFSNLFQKYLI